MKKFLYFSIVGLALTLAACNSNEKNAHGLIKDYLSKNLDDAASYEAVEFGELDSVFNPYINTPEGKDLWEKGGLTGTFHQRAFDLEIAIISEKNPEIVAIYEDSIKIYKQLEVEYEQKFEKNDKSYKGDFIGWEMKHKFRAKNKFGGVVLDAKRFRFNKEFTEVTNVINI